MASISYDPGNIDPKVANVIDEVVVSVQAALNPRMTDIPYSARNFWTNSGTWTVSPGHQILHRYAVVGGMMHLQTTLYGTTTAAGMGIQLSIAVPDGYRCTGGRAFVGCFNYTAVTAGVSTTGFAFEAADGRSIRLLRDALSAPAWPSSETNLILYMNFVFPVIGL